MHPQRQPNAKEILAPPSARRGDKTSSKAINWDDDTVVAPAPTKVQTEGGTKVTSTMIPLRTKHKKVEEHRCTISGCIRMFISEAELMNHIEVLHSINEEQAVPRRDISLTTGSQLPERDQTIRPTPITAESLRALNRSTSTDISRSMEDLSISDACRRPPSVVSFDTTYSIMDGIEERPISEVAEEDALSIRLPVRILLFLWTKLVVDMTKRFGSGIRTHTAERQAKNTAHSAAQSEDGQGSSPRQLSQTSSVKSFKRQRPEDDDDDDASTKPNKKGTKSRHLSPENKPLACPFNKWDNFVFGGDSGNVDYLVCSTFNNVKTAYLKQHLLRNHCIPEYHCDRCGIDCKNPGRLRDHRRTDPPCSVKELDSQKIMPETQTELQLRTRNVVGLDRVTYWYKVYDTVFGSEARRKRPIKPFYEGPSYEVLQSFLRFSERRMSGVLRSSRQHLRIADDSYNEHNPQLVQMILQEASLAYMSEIKSTRPPSLREIKEKNSTGSSEIEHVLDENTIRAKDTKLISDLQEHTMPGQAAELPRLTPGTNHAAQVFSQAHFPQLPSGTIDDNSHLPQTMSIHDHQVSGQHLQYETTDWSARDFEDLPYLNMPEFDTAIEDTDLYGSSALQQTDFDDFHLVDSPTDLHRRERRVT